MQPQRMISIRLKIIILKTFSNFDKFYHKINTLHECNFICDLVLLDTSLVFFFFLITQGTVPLNFFGPKSAVKYGGRRLELTVQDLLWKNCSSS